MSKKLTENSLKNSLKIRLLPLYILDYSKKVKRLGKLQVKDEL